jgi:transcriptional regulator with XRE-family HTH domain
MAAQLRNRKAQRTALVASLRAEGSSWIQVATQIKAIERVSVLAAFRLAHGLSQQAVADQWNALFVADTDADKPLTDKQVSYWETFPQSGREPTLTTLKRLARIYHCAAADLLDDGDFRHLDEMTACEPLIPDQKDGQAVDSAWPDARPDKAALNTDWPAGNLNLIAADPAESEDAMERRQLLQSMAVLGISISPASHALEVIRGSVGKAFRHNDRDHLDDWDETVTEYGYAYVTTSPGDLIADLAADLVTVRSIMAGVSADSADYRGWCRISGALSGLMAKTLSNLGQSRDARRWWSIAQHVTDDSGDLDLSLWVRGERIVHGLYEDRPAAILLRQIAEATEFARGHACIGLAEMSGAHAQLLALSGNSGSAEAELQRTEDILVRLPPTVTGDTSTVLNWGETRLRYTETWVYAHLGDEKATDLAAQRAIRLYPASDSRTPTQIRLMQAFGRVQAGDLSEGLRHARVAYEGLPADQRTTMVTGLARSIADAVPAISMHRCDVLSYRELVAAPARRAIES